MNDDFEKRLQQVAPREIPSAWRKEILTAAQEAKASPFTSRSPQPGFLLNLVRQLSTRALPQRIAWAAIASVWLLILSLNFAARDHSAPPSTTAALPTRETLQALKQQRRLLAELVERATPRAADRPPATPVSPRSQRRETTITA